MSLKYLDAHCHIQFDQYAEDHTALIEQMREEGVAGIIVGVDYHSSEKAIALAERYEHLYAAIGLHPNRENEEVFNVSIYQTLAQHQKVVAIGECGLDYFRPTHSDNSLKERQQTLFKQHIALATELGKPLIVHARPSKGSMDAYRDLIAILKEAKHTYPGLGGDIHFFVGGQHEAEALVALGFTLSFTAVITFARDYDEVIRAIPLDSILSETDAPYVAPISRRGQRNDPLTVIDIVRKIADIRNENEDIVRVTLLKNAQRVFSVV